MSKDLNTKEWRELEKKWSNSLKDGKKVEVKIEPVYLSESKRPDKFKIRYKIGEEEYKFESFENAIGVKQK